MILNALLFFLVFGMIWFGLAYARFGKVTMKDLWIVIIVGLVVEAGFLLVMMF